MFDRIIKRLSGEDDPNLKKALNTIEDMNISTIHSFCYKLLQERSFDAGLPIGVSLLEESELNALKAQYFREYMSGLEESDWSALTELQEKNSRYFVNGDVYTIYSKICNLQQEYFDSISCPKKLLDDETVRNRTEEIIREFISSADKCVSKIDPHCSSLQELINSGDAVCLGNVFNGEAKINDKRVGNENKPQLKSVLFDDAVSQESVLITLKARCECSDKYFVNPTKNYDVIKKNHCC